MPQKKIKVALIGNPNCGKTTLFNSLTGSSQHVGNWPGVTVEKKVGSFKNSEYEIEITDLPGIYSLSPYSQEEIVSRDCVLSDKQDVIINIIDANNMERNLYLTTQLLELNRPIILVVNMVDIIKKKGEILNFAELSKGLGCACLPISASKGIGIESLISKIIEIKEKKISELHVDIYSSKTSSVIKAIESVILKDLKYELNNSKFYAVKIFEDDFVTMKDLGISLNAKKKICGIKNSNLESKKIDREMIIANERYNFISKICKDVFKKKKILEAKTYSDKIDDVVAGRYFAIPVLILVMSFIFFLSFGPLGNTLRDFFAEFINIKLRGFFEFKLTELGASNVTLNFLLNGVLAGVGSVISFLPQIIILFSLLSILEDSGYMARCAFIMDKPLRKIGLSGKAFVSMLMGFGCTVPAILSTRTLESERDRRVAIMTIPFMSCSAKMPLFALLSSVFFKERQVIIVASLYILGIIIGVLSASFLKNKIAEDEYAFVMEMPDYHIPVFKNLVLHVWSRVKDFITKAGTVLLCASIVIWFFQTFDFGFNMVEDSADSIISKIGGFIAPIFWPCGFNNWKAVVSLLTGIIAKESIVTSLSILNGGSVFLDNAVSEIFTPLSAYSFLVFVLLYTPCIAALSVIFKELKSFKKTLFFIIYQLIIAWGVSALVFALGNIFYNINSAVIFLTIVFVLIMIARFIKSINTGKAKVCSGDCEICDKICKDKDE